MRTTLLALVLLLALPLVAQDRVTLTNGDVITGQLAALADGKLTVRSPVLGDVVVPIDQVATMVTQEPVELLTTDGERLRRRITGIDGGRLQLAAAGADAPPAPSLALSSLDKINPPADPAPRWQGSLTINSSISIGNTERRAIGSALDAVRRSELDRFTVDAAWDYAEDRQPVDPADPTGPQTWRLNQRRVGGGLKYDYFLSRRMYVLATTRALGDTRANLDLRYTAGAGLGYQWCESPTFDFSTEAGLSYFNESYRTVVAPDPDSVDYVTARAAYKLRWDLSDTTRLIHSVEAFPSIEQASDVYLTADTRLQTDLTRAMIAQLQWVWDYDNTPSRGFERSDHRFIVSVGWKF